MKTPKMPAPPDPNVTAAAQSGMNADTARMTQLTNMVNQVTPDGTLTYSKTGQTKYRNSQNKLVKVPIYTATQTLSPAQQALYDLNNQTEANIATIGRDQSARIGKLLGEPLKLQGGPIDLSNEAVEARLMELGSKRLTPRFASEEESLRTRLINSGIQPGSAAFEAEMRGMNEGKNDAYNQLLLNGRAQSVDEIFRTRNQMNQETMAERNAPINEISALLSGSQVSMPEFVNTPSTQVAGVDYAGMVKNNYAAQMDGWKQKVASNNAAMGGLFGLASAPFGMFNISM